MSLVSLKPGTPPVDVEFPGGALHLYPGTFRAVTAEQLETLRNDATLADRLVVIDSAPAPAAPPAEAEAPAARVIITDPPAGSEPEPTPPTKPQDKQRHTRRG